jgi:short-subunit dehydrogenase
MRRILVVGATSAIAQAFARQAAAAGDRLHLVGRSATRLQAVADDLQVRGAAQVSFSTADFAVPHDVEPWLAAADEALGGFDAVLLAHGVLTDQSAAERDASLLRQDFEVNFLSAAAVLHGAARRLEERGTGVLVVISSVAGDRGRRSNYVYGSAKAALTTFAEGLRHRLHGAGVRVVVVKPGFVDTPMTAHVPKNPLFASAGAVGTRIYGTLARDGVVYVPWFWSWIMRLVRWLPDALFLRTRL